MGKAETASRDKNVSGAADSGESRIGGTRAVSFSDPGHNNFGRTMRSAELSLEGRPHREVRLPGSRARRTDARPKPLHAKDTTGTQAGAEVASVMYVRPNRTT